MVGLDSNRWDELKATLAAELVSALRSLLDESETIAETDQSAWNKWNDAWWGVWHELGEQMAHQWTLSPAAYLAVPHLVGMGEEFDSIKEPWFLIQMARIAAPYQIILPLPDDLKEDYEKALHIVAQVSLNEASTNNLLAADDYWSVLRCATSFHRQDTLIWLLADSKEHTFSCPHCSEYLYFLRTDTGCEVERCDWKSKSQVPKTQVTPRCMTNIQWNPEDQPADDFEWLTALCQSAQQHEVLEWICFLFGEAVCPECGGPVTINVEVGKECPDIKRPL
ncbi:MAG: hypothetical protein K1Y36_23085 [Blastocatellia bacterium]|nr:hypothetical protein [Blastocatellia bacterium]